MALLFEENQLEKILSDYHDLIGIGIGFYDADYQPIVLMPKNGWGFCNIIRQNEAVQKQCSACDKLGFDQVKKTKELTVYKCHMGLYEAIAPILDNQVIIGYIMVGRLLDEQSMEYQWTNIKHKCTEYGFSEEMYEEAFNKLKQLSHKEIEAAASIMHACAAYLCFKNIVHMERSGLFEKIHQYIVDHLSETMTQDLLCDHFEISKSTLYNTLKAHTSMSLIPYIRELRLKEAKRLLVESSLKIKEVAECCGISDYNYFTRVFKKTYHYTPRDYRQQHSYLSPL